MRAAAPIFAHLAMASILLGGSSVSAGETPQRRWEAHGASSPAGSPRRLPVKHSTTNDRTCGLEGNTDLSTPSSVIARPIDAVVAASALQVSPLLFPQVSSAIDSLDERLRVEQIRRRRPSHLLLIDPVSASPSLRLRTRSARTMNSVQRPVSPEAVAAFLHREPGP